MDMDIEIRTFSASRKLGFTSFKGVKSDQIILFTNLCGVDVERKFQAGTYSLIGISSFFSLQRSLTRTSTDRIIIHHDGSRKNWKFQAGLSGIPSFLEPALTDVDTEIRTFPASEVGVYKFQECIVSYG